MASALPVSLHVAEDGRNPENAADKEEEEQQKISKFLDQLKNLNLYPFFYNQENMANSPNMSFLGYRKVEPSIQAIDLGDIKHFSLAKIEELTNNFSNQNLFCYLRNGRLFKAIIENGSESRKVAIKVWDLYNPNYTTEYGARRFYDEIVLLMDPAVRARPDFVKLIGYSCETKMALVYDVEPKYTLNDFLASADFGWKSRMKVAKDFAKLLTWSHENLIAFGSLDAKDILIDEQWNILLFEFGFYSRVKDKNDPIIFKASHLEFGYVAPRECIEFPKQHWYLKSDVYSYGVLLLHLITKRQRDMSIVYWAQKEWAQKKIEAPGYCSLVHETFKDEVQNGFGITELAMWCLTERIERPEMQTVADRLNELA